MFCIDLNNDKYIEFQDDFCPRGNEKQREDKDSELETS